MATPFPEQLMEIIDDEANSHIVSWLPAGDGFTIHDEKKFEQIILPKIMQKVKYASFVRRMNRWNFVHKTISLFSTEYFHPQFIKGDYNSVRKMTTQPQKKRHSTYDDDEWRYHEEEHKGQHEEETREPASDASSKRKSSKIIKKVLKDINQGKSSSTHRVQESYSTNSIDHQVMMVSPPEEALVLPSAPVAIVFPHDMAAPCFSESMPIFPVLPQQMLYSEQNYAPYFIEENTTSTTPLPAQWFSSVSSNAVPNGYCYEGAEEYYHLHPYPNNYHYYAYVDTEREYYYD